MGEENWVMAVHQNCRCLSEDPSLPWLKTEISIPSGDYQKMHAPWKESYDKPRQCIKNQSHHLATKVRLVKAMAFPSSHIQMWELDHKEGWALKNWCFRIVVLEKTLESPLDCKEISPGCSLVGLKLKLQYFGHMMWRPNSLEKTLMLGKIEGRRQWQRMRWLDGISNSVDMNLSKLQGIVKDREAWRAAAHGITKSQMWRGDWTTNNNDCVRNSGWC